MTTLTGDKSVTRAVLATHRGRQLVVTLYGHTLTIREKGRRKGYAVSYSSIFNLGALKQAEELRRAKAEVRKAKKRIK